MDHNTASLILAGLQSPALILDGAGRVQIANPSCTELFGHDPTGLSAVAWMRQPTVVAAIERTGNEGVDAQARFMLTGVSGERIFLVRTHALGARANGNMLITFEDISVQEEADLRRRDFVANISHELRTPLTSLTGFIETLRTSARDDPEARARFLGIMDREARRMGRLVADLLSLSRVEADERVRPRTLVDVSAVLRSVVATLEGKLKQSRVSVEISGHETPQRIRGDHDQLTQLFLNLLENAIKYGGPDRQVQVNVSRVARDATLRAPALRVDVQDQGEGIDPLHLPRLTERFYRIDDHRSREMGGTGLGLAIVKHILNRHRGRLKITSEQGLGSCFSCIFPAPEDL